MKLRWFVSSTVRQASDMCKHVRKLLKSQRDRDNVEVFLVAIVVAMGIRTFFLQPFKIPTGSMQPTLFGVTIKDLRGDPNFKMPGLFQRAYELAVHGTIYHQLIAPQDGEIDTDRMAMRPSSFLHFINRQTIWVRYASGEEVPLTIWCGPDDPANQARWMYHPYFFHKGEPILCFKETTGDHLFVDRLTYNFRQPHRGDIIVFKTKGIEGIRDQDQFYIKRLIGLGGETISIGEDRHVRINGHRLDASTPHFENVYGFDPKSEAEENHYSGHTLDGRSNMRTPASTLYVEPGHFAAFGDNTVNSADSRYWGELPENNVIGKSFFVYWPITSRFGWGQQ
jgi:signal peptidase I